MNTTLNRFDRLLAAITFAEANEPEMAEEYISRRRPERNNRAQEKAPLVDGRILPNQTAH